MTTNSEVRNCTTCRFHDLPASAPECVGPACEIVTADSYSGWHPRSDHNGAPRKPKLLILGHGRHGKDTVAEILRDNHGFTFASSSYFAAEKAVRPALAACGVVYETLDECYADRVNRRAFWYEAISAFNENPTKLASAILAENDMYVGMRSSREFKASRELFDIVLWVDATARGLPLEPASSLDIQFDPNSMYLIDNNGDLDGLRENVAAFVRALSYLPQ